MDKETILYSW